MADFTLSYDEHAAIYSAALVILCRVVCACAPALIRQLPAVVYRRLVIYCAGLCTLRKYQTCLGISRQLGSCSHDALNRLLHSTKWSVGQVMLACLQSALALAAGTSQPCWLILDDVILPKPASKKMAAAYWDYDYVHDKHIRCLRVVVVCWTNGLIKVPVAWALWHKKGSTYLLETGTKFRTKNQLGRLLVALVQRKGLPFDFLLFDSWYAGTEHLAWYHSRGIRFVTAIKCNHHIRLPFVPSSQSSQQVQTTSEVWVTTSPTELAGEYPHSRSYHYFSAIACRTRRWEITLEGFPDCLSLVCIKNYVTTPAFKKFVTPAEKKQKDPNKYLLTNATDLTIVEIVTWYRRRWSIEVMFRDCKQFLGLAAYQGQAMQAHAHHISCVFFSYVLMEHMKSYVTPAPSSANTLTIGEVKEWLTSQFLLRMPNTATPSVALVTVSLLSETDLIPLLEETTCPIETGYHLMLIPQLYQLMKLKIAA